MQINQNSGNFRFHFQVFLTTIASNCSPHIFFYPCNDCMWKFPITHFIWIILQSLSNVEQLHMLHRTIQGSQPVIFSETIHGFFKDLFEILRTLLEDIKPPPNYDNISITKCFSLYHLVCSKSIKQTNTWSQD